MRRAAVCDHARRRVMSGRVGVAWCGDASRRGGPVVSCGCRESHRPPRVVHVRGDRAARESKRVTAE